MNPFVIDQIEAGAKRIATVRVDIFDKSIKQRLDIIANQVNSIHLNICITSTKDLCCVPHKDLASVRVRHGSETFRCSQSIGWRYLAPLAPDRIAVTPANVPGILGIVARRDHQKVV